MAGISSNDDLYVDLTSPKPSTSRGKDSVPDEIWIADEEENTIPLLEEEKLKKAEMNLYAELLESDIDKRKEKTRVTAEYEDLQKQVLHLQALLAEKDSKLSALTLQDANVRKNICSLYKTARAEIDHKDSLLTEANSRLDSILYRRNLTIDQLEKQTPQTSIAKSKSNEDKSAREENPKESNAESHALKSHSDGNEKNQSSIKRKRSHSPPSNNKNAKIEKNSVLDKRQNCDSKTVCNSPQPVSKDNLNNKKSFDSNPTKVIETEKSDINKSNNSNSGQNSPGLANSEHTNLKQNCDLNSAHNNSASKMHREPSIAEVFSKMQELAFKDPATTNAIFFNLLPGELRQSFLEFEQTQMNALNKLKQSFVNCYFMQCSASGSGASTPEENSGGNAESQNSSAFFFQQSTSNSKTENNNQLSASNNHSDSGSKSEVTVSEGNEVKAESDVQKSGKKPVTRHKTKEEDVLSLHNNHSDSASKPHVTVSEGNEVKTESDVQKSGKRHVTRHKTKREDVLSLHKYRDENLTLYTQRHIRRQQN